MKEGIESTGDFIMRLVGASMSGGNLKPPEKVQIKTKSGLAENGAGIGVWELDVAREVSNSSFCAKVLFWICQSCT